MRLLLIAGLRHNLNWFKWVERHAVEFDVVAIVGDLLDVFHPLAARAQIIRARSHLESLAGKAYVVVCSGNHDSLDLPAAPPRGPVPGWMAGLDEIGSLLSDGRTGVIKDQLVVTTLSYLSTEQQKRRWLVEGDRLRTQTGLPWLLLHHYPPAIYQGDGPEELSAGKLVREFEPTFWLSGRFYEEPYHKEFVWVQRINRTIALNAAQYPMVDQTSESPLPSHIILDMTKGSVVRCSPSLNRIEEAALGEVDAPSRCETELPVVSYELGPGKRTRNS
jgi:hypothetical protein